MKKELVRHRPYLTGLLLGLAIWLIANILAVGLAQVALVFIGAGVVLAVYGDGWYQPAGKMLAATGATLVLTPIVYGVLFATLD